MDKRRTTASSKRLATFLERTSGLRRDDREAIVDRLIDRLYALDAAENWRIAA